MSASRKNKIHLTDYDVDYDIQSRMLMADFSTFDLEVIEEVLFNPLKISIKKLGRSLDCTDGALLTSLHKISSTGLFSLQDETLIVDKEKRKYFESQVSRFRDDFKPDIEYLLSLLKKVPIHILPTWYSIPRHSNNIFESILEKYLLTPQIYQRYLADLHFADPAAEGILRDVLSSPILKVASTDLITRYNLSRRAFEEIILLLEFHFACCLVYEKEDDHWIESVSAFYEWRDYQLFLKKTEVSPLDPAAVQPLPFRELSREKLQLLQLSQEDWAAMDLSAKALFLYRHPLNQILSHPEASEKSIREAEKSIRRVLHGQWVLFDDFFQGVHVSLNEEPIVLKKLGKHWSYVLPTYSEGDKKLIRTTIFEWLFEMGMVNVGTFQGRDCFCVTPIGRSFFEE